VGATREDFARAGRELPGARRPVLLKVTVDGDSFAREPSPAAGTAANDPDLRAVRLRFSLAAGGYATVVIEALLQQGAA
jgi:tRNA(Glu) U13 pseudouridine synthase TruD